MPDKTAIVAEKAPAALGPYSAAIRVGRRSCTARARPRSSLRPASSSRAASAARHGRCSRTSRRCSRPRGSRSTDVVKTTVFLTDMADFAKMNDVYAEFFAEPFPARSTVAVKALPKAASVEIEVIAVVA